MLWTLIKVIVFFCLVAALAFGVEFLAGSTDQIQLIFMGTEYTIPPLLFVIGLAVLLLAMWLTLKLAGITVALLRFINGDETALSRYFDKNREQKGFQALTDALLAMASGEPEKARTYAAKADRFLQQPALTNLVKAQAFEAIGDRKSADQLYRTMLNDDKTRFLAVQGLLNDKLTSGDDEKAIALAEKAIGLKPKHAPTLQKLWELQTRNEDWAGAGKTLTAQLKAGQIDKGLHRRRFAVLATAKAQDLIAEGKAEPALKEIAEANRIAPELVPAAVLYARMLSTDGQARKAAKVLKVCWKALPHPDIAAAYADIVPEETPQARLKRFNPLLKVNPEHPETVMLAAELNLAADQVQSARDLLGNLHETSPSARALTLIAAIEKADGSEDYIVRAWLSKAATAPRGAQWVCDICGTVHEKWAPLCDNCNAFDTLSWTTPEIVGNDDFITRFPALLEGPDTAPITEKTPQEIDLK